MKRMLLLLVSVVLLGTVPLAAQAEQLFDFNGQAILPAGVGGSLSLYSIVTNNGILPTPIPIDEVTNQYTVVVTNLVLLMDGTPQQYANGAIAIYEDPIAGGTAADFSNASTFTDGTAILTGNVVSLARFLFGQTGTATGTVDWTGGSRIDDIHPDDRVGWRLNSGVSIRASDVEPGYDEAWDGKVEPLEDIVASETRSWGNLKNEFDAER
jgi:opacity protein-like surface antigen